MALEASNLKIVVDARRLEVACYDLNWALHRVITRDRGLEDARATLKKLERLERGDPDAVRSVWFRAGPSGTGTFSTAHPFINMLLQQAIEWRRLSDPDWAVSNDSDQAKAELAGLAFIAAEQYRAGIRLNSKQLKIRSRQHGERLGLCAIDVYCCLTGRAPARSTSPDTGRCPGKPTGPLVRFLKSIYLQLGSLQINGRNEPSRSRLEGLNPSDHTLVRWIRVYQKARSAEIYDQKD